MELFLSSYRMCSVTIVLHTLTATLIRGNYRIRPSLLSLVYPRGFSEDEMGSFCVILTKESCQHNRVLMQDSGMLKRIIIQV